MKSDNQAKRVAVVFSQGPHGTSAGREGLDALLATSALTEDIGVFLSRTAFYNCYRGSSQKNFSA